MEDANGASAMNIKAAAGYTALLLSVLILATAVTSPFVAVAGGGGW